MTTPPDRSHIATEGRNERSMNLHALSARQCVDLIVAEDRAVFEAMDRARGDIAALVEAAEPGFVAGGRLIYLGAGTSGRLGALDASEAPPTFQVEPGRVVGIIAGGDRSLRVSSEAREDDRDGAREQIDALGLCARDTVIGIAAGGTTPYVLGGVEIAKPSGATTGLIVCTPIDRPAFVDHLIALETGPEVVTGSTRMKAGTATKMTLNTISTTLMVRQGRVFENMMVDLRATNAKLRDRAARIVATLAGLERDEAFVLLDRAGGSVKVAIVMARLDLERNQAEQRLAACESRLDRVLGA
jgi:N-acetylmuramic acid 6-phosphate etherase